MANNASKQKLSLNVPTPSAKEEDVKAFIDKAENHTKVARGKKDKPVESLPWEAEGINTEQMKSLRLGLHEEYLLKLKYLSEKSGIPQQKIARTILYPAIDEYIEQLKTQGFIKL